MTLRAGPAVVAALAAAVLAAGTAVSGASGAADAAAPAAAPTATPSQERPRFTIALDRLEPKAVREDSVLSIGGTLLNSSGETQRDVSVQLRVSSKRIATRYDLDQESSTTARLGIAISSTRQNLGSLDAGATAYWHISVPASDLGLPSSAALFGAYPLEIEATSTASSGIDRTELPTTLMWMPDGAQFTPTQLSWLWPLVDGVHQGLGEKFLDDDLARDLAPDGRLGKLVDVAAKARLPLTYMVDPALVDAATTMAASVPTVSATPGASTPPASAAPGSAAAGSTPNSTPSPGATPSVSPSVTTSPSPIPSPYRVESGGVTTPGVGAVAASIWLTQLRAAITATGSALVALPYGDADLAALDRAGLSKEIAVSRSTGQALLSEELAAPTLPDVVWPVDSVINVTTLDNLASDMVDTVVLTGQAVQPRDPDAVGTPRTDLQTASGPVRAVLTDTTIDTLLTDPGSIAGGARAAEQRILAETMLVTEQRPGSGSSLVLAPPRDVDPDQFLTTILTDTGDVPWLQLVGLGEIANQPADDIARRPLAYPRSAREAELPTSALAAISGLRTQVAAFDSVLGSSTSEPFLDADSIAISRAESSWWRSDPGRSTRILDAVRDDLNKHAAEVFISNPRLITMTSRKQKIPITIVNNLPDPVTVQIKLTAVNAARLTVTPSEPLTVDGKGNRLEVLIEVEATTSGRFQVEAQLTTPDTTAAPFGQPVTFELNSTAYGAVALAIAGGAAGLLFLLSGIRIFRRMRRARASRRQPGGTPPTGAGTSPGAAAAS